jgi:hypothetical protein
MSNAEMPLQALLCRDAFCTASMIPVGFDRNRQAALDQLNPAAAETIAKTLGSEDFLAATLPFTPTP